MVEAAADGDGFHPDQCVTIRSATIDYPFRGLATAFPMFVAGLLLSRNGHEPKLSPT